MLVLGAALNFVILILLASTPVFPKSREFRWFLYYGVAICQASNR